MAGRDGKHREQAELRGGQGARLGVMGHPPKDTESWSSSSSDLAESVSRTLCPVGKRSQSPWALAVGVVIPKILLPCWLICHGTEPQHTM